MNLFRNWFKNPQCTNTATFVAKNNVDNSIDFYLDGSSKNHIMSLLLSLTLNQYIIGCLQNCEQKYPGFTKEYNELLKNIQEQIISNNKNNYISPLE